jgi:hypothetical protein
MQTTCRGVGVLSTLANHKHMHVEHMQTTSRALVPVSHVRTPLATDDDHDDGRAPVRLRAPRAEAAVAAPRLRPPRGPGLHLSNGRDLVVAKKTNRMVMPGHSSPNCQTVCSWSTRTHHPRTPPSVLPLPPSRAWLLVFFAAQR